MRDDYDIGPGSVATGGGGAPTLDEIYEASQEATRLNATRGSRLLSLERAYDEASDTIRAATMQQLANPVRSPVGPSTMQAPGVDGGEDPHLAWDRQVGELRQRFPDKAPFFKTSDEIVAAAARMRREAEEHSADIEARRPGFFSDPRATGAMLAGSFAGMLRDPGQAIEVAATGWIGFGKTLLWNAVGNAAVNATSDALSQPLIQSWRKEAGLDYGLGHAASSVAMSAIFGGALDAGVRGAARGLGAGRARLRGDDISVREAILEGITPREQLERAARARPDGDVLRRAAGGDEGAQIEVARQMGLDKADPEVRGAIHAIEAERELQAATPRAAVAESDHLAATAQALRHALDGEAPPRAPELLREAAPDPEARARLDAAADPLEAARILKESPGALADHPMADSDFMRVASGLARVSDELAAHVEAGRVRPDLAGIVGHMVERDGDQLRLAEALQRAEPASEAEARKLLSEALRTPRDAETMTALAVPESPARVLSAPRGEALARAMPDLLADPRLKGVLGDDGAAAIASLAAIRGPVSDALTKAAEAIAAGADRKATSRALASRIAGLVDERGLAHLAEGDGRVLAHNGVDDPTGADAKLQIERLQRTVDWGDEGREASVGGAAGQIGEEVAPPFSIRSGDYGLAPAASRDLPAIRAEVDKAAKALPADVRVRLEERLHFGDREIDGRYDIAERVVYASLASADPARIVRHETIHALKASGLLASGEYEILRRHAEAGDLRKAYNIDDRYEKAYGGKLEALRERAKAAKDADAETKAALQGDIARETDRVEGLLWEETVAEMFADHRAGKSFGGAIDRILKTISDFLERVRNGLSGRGFKTVEDVFGAIEKGDVAGRKPVDPPTATGSRLAIEDMPTETTPRQAYDDAAGLMQQHEMVGWCK